MSDNKTKNRPPCLRIRNGRLENEGTVALSAAAVQGDPDSETKSVVQGSANTATYHEKAASVIFCFLADYCLLAGIFTFFDTTGLHYPMTILTDHSYSWHYLMIIMAFLCHAQLRSGQMRR